MSERAIALRLGKRDRRFKAGKLSESQRIIFGDKGWYWYALVYGSDLIVRGAIATWFGGANDPQDNGETASGVNTKDQPDIMGCALPMRGFPDVKSVQGSPLPRIPWHTPVYVSVPFGITIQTTLIDLGPSRYTNHAIDLTTHAFKQLGGDLGRGLLSVDYRIIGGANYL